MATARALPLVLLFAAGHSRLTFEPGGEYCKSKMNPLETAIALRTATDILWSCRKEAVKLNLHPDFVQEFDKVCIAIKLCYRYAGNPKKVNIVLQSKRSKKIPFSAKKEAKIL
ncbi:hypothetical protein MTO96_031529 [Rhipicephalus appendiculatus]